jgi:hypothetical protein
MPFGYFTIERLKSANGGGEPQWVTVAHVHAHQSLSDALAEIERRGKAGYFRVTQMQRVIWAEKIDGKLKLRKWHAGSPASLARGAKAFVRDKGRYSTKLT